MTKEYAEIDPDTALIMCNSLLNLSQEQQTDSLISKVFLAYTYTYSYLAVYDSSSTYAYKALKSASHFNDTTVIIDSYTSLGINFMYTDDKNKASRYFEKALEVALLYGDSLRLGHAFTNVGLMYGLDNNYEEELKNYHKAARIFKAINETEGYANIQLNMGTVYTQLRKYDIADSLYNIALHKFSAIRNSSGMQNTIQSMAENHLTAGIPDIAKSEAIQALDIAQQSGFVQDEIYTYELLSKIAVSKRDFKSAYDYEIKRSNKKETVFNTEKSKQIAKLEIKYETEKKEFEIDRLYLENALKDANLARSRNIQFMIGISVIILILSLIVFYSLRSKRLRAEHEAQELRVEALQKRLLELNANDTNLNLDYDLLNKKLHNALSPREFETLQLSITGKTNSEIADALFISISTVKFHLRNIYSKLGVNNRKEALQYVSQSS